MSSINKIPYFTRMAEELKRDVVRYAEVAGVNHFQDSFFNQGFTDRSFEPWDDIKQKLNPTRAILINSGYLRDSIQVFESNQKQITFGSDAEYAGIHNEGGPITITNTPKAKRFFWYMYKKTDQEKFKWMALSKKAKFKIYIPQRQFIGESVTLMNNLDEWVVNEILNRFGQIKQK